VSFFQVWYGAKISFFVFPLCNARGNCLPAVSVLTCYRLPGRQSGVDHWSL